MGRKIVWPYQRQLSADPTHRCSSGVDDESFGHLNQSWSMRVVNGTNAIDRSAASSALHDGSYRWQT